MSIGLHEEATVLQRIEDLPVLPRAALAAMQALRNEDSGAELCAELIGRDPVLAARTLRIANSSFYGMSGRIGGLRDAVLLLGRRPLATLVTALAVGHQFPAGHCVGFDFSAFWRHATASAIAARAIARELRMDEDLAFTAGLLHDIGALALASQLPREFEPVLAAATAEDLPLHEVEPALLGTDHAALGALLVRRWQLGEPLAEAIATHHRPSAAGTPPPSLGMVVHAADAIAHALDLSGLEHERVAEADLPTWSALNLAAPQLLRILEETEQQSLALFQALAAE